MIIICVESSHARGMGHVYRMSYLAAEMQKRGLNFCFVVNPDIAALELLSAKHFPKITVDFESSDWQRIILKAHDVKLWIDDRMETDAHHSMILISHNIPIVTFDNVGPGAAFANLSIYGMAYRKQNNLQGKKILSGLKWNLIDPQIYRFRRQRTEMRSLVITFGGTDTYGMTPELYGAVRDIYPNITIVTGPGFQHHSQLQACIDEKPQMNLQWKKNVPSLAEEFALHDLAITAGGVTPFEANAAGLPCFIVATEPHEIDNAKFLAPLGGSIYAGFRHEFDRDIVRNKPNIAEMSNRAMSAIPDGAAERILAEILKLLPRLPKAPV